VRQKRRSYREHDDDDDVIGDELATLNERLEDITRQLATIAQSNAGARFGATGGAYHAPDHIADRHTHFAPRQDAPVAPQNPDTANWAAQISARQRALDGDAHAAAPPTASRPVTAQVASGAASGLTSLERTALEQAMVSLRGTLSNATSDSALAQLAAEVHALTAQVERAAADNSANGLGKLEAKIAALMENGRAVPPELENSIRELSNRLDRIQLSQGDQVALRALEDRIAKLSEKLDASDARLGNLGAIERGLADLLVYLEEMRDGDSRGLRAPTPAAATPAPAPAAQPPQVAKPMPPVRERAPINPNLPPNTPIEPGNGTPRFKPGSAAARIAASEAALGGTMSAAAEFSDRSTVITAARNAARAAANLGAPVTVQQSSDHQKRGWSLSNVFKRTPTIPPAPIDPAPSPVDDMADAPPTRGKRLRMILKTILIAASIAIIVLGVAHTALELLLPDISSTPSTTETRKGQPTSTAPGRPIPAPQSPQPTAPGADPDTTGKIGGSTSLFDPSTAVIPNQQHANITNTITRQPAPPRATAPNLPAGDLPSDSLPASISPALRIAAAANDPAAEYELGSRYAEGRGVPQNLQEAGRWFERAANAGFAPAQFRLASLNEKGEGRKKDVQTARRLYLAAADKGHAKAMHNLAVLHAEGIDGKPDYKAAAEWFGKAAAYGVTDSQYNLAVLYARGIGVGANLAESYKWFALAAANGDSDAAKKRDEVAARLDRQALMAAKLSAQTFIPEREPEEATSVKAPPGGWDKAAAAPARPRRQLPASTAQ